MVVPPTRSFGDPTAKLENGVIVDVRRYPLVLVRMAGKIADAQFEEYLTFMESLPNVDNDPNYHGVLLFDMSEAAPLSAAQRRRQAEWVMAQREERMNSRTDVGFVLSNGILRGALQAVFWFISRDVAYTVWPTLSEAMYWAQGRLRQSSVA